MRLKIILLIKKMLGPKVWNAFLEFKRKIIFLTHPGKYSDAKKHLLQELNPNTVLLIGTPQHGNVGDQAIVCASLDYIKNTGISSLYEIPVTQYYLYKRLLKLYCKQNTFCLHGGGNMGIDYFRSEQVRRDIIKSFPQNKLIIFPQTIDYGTTPRGLKELANSKEIYNSHSNLTIFARETYSYELMKKNYSNANIYLVPDIVLSWKPVLPTTNRSGALFCLRHDKESIFSAQSREDLLKKTKVIFPNTQISDTWAAQSVNNDSRYDYVMNKLKEFRSSQLVITDRLHGMIFAAITQTPCIVFGNYNHKVEYEYEWIKDCPYITFLKSTSEFEPILAEYCHKNFLSSFTFDYLEKQFQPIYNSLKADQ